MVVRVTRVNKHEGWGFPSGSSGKEPACQRRKHRRCGFNPWSERSPGGGHGNLLQSSGLENPMEREGWRATVHGVAKSQTQLSDLAQHARSIKDSYTQHVHVTQMWSGVTFAPKIQVELALKSMNALVIFQIPETVLAGGRKKKSATLELKALCSVAQSCLILWPHRPQPTGLLHPWGSLGGKTGVGCHASPRGSSQPRDWTRISYVSSIGKRVLYH